ncbi:MAG TPA: septum formation initiator family protein [Bacteroidaceae bacterium]|nr:septum formation initiator family protein [Bacteroidaceae bacterium]
MSSFFQIVWQAMRKNKYIFVLVTFILIIVFFDENNLIKRTSQKREIKALNEEIQRYQTQINDGEKLLEDLESDTLLRERIAREKYNMRKDDEDIFVER